MDRQTYFSLNPWWEGRKFETGVPRPFYLESILSRFDREQIEIIVGSRRVGKTTLLKQLIARQLSSHDPENVFYLSCDHPQASNTSLREHLQSFRKIFSHNRKEHLLVFLDEVQESPNWQIELKNLYDNENIKIVCSGSTSALIESHGGKLTGRQISTVVYPLSFTEFLSFRDVKPRLSEGYLLEKQFQDYLKVGGYPENVLNPSEDYLQALLDDIFLRDLVRLHPVKNLTVVRDLFQLLAASVGTRVSFNKLSNTLGISLDTVKKYIEYLENAFLVKKMTQWATSHRKKVYAPKKIYLLDTGLKTLVTGEGDFGFKAETTVFTHLLRQGKEPGYFAESQKEVDFVTGNHKEPIPIEVKYTDDLELSDRRLAGLRLFLKEHPNTQEAVVVTKNVEKEETHRDVRVSFVPIWQYLLEQ